MRLTLDARSSVQYPSSLADFGGGVENEGGSDVRIACHSRCRFPVSADASSLLTLLMCSIVNVTGVAGVLAEPGVTADTRINAASLSKRYAIIFLGADLAPRSWQSLAPRSQVSPRHEADSQGARSP